MKSTDSIAYTIVSTAEIWAWDEGSDDSRFAHTKVIATDQTSTIYHANIPAREHLIVPERVWDQLKVIPSDHIYPPYIPTFTKFEGILDDSVYHKKPQLDSYDETYYLADVLEKEAYIYEKLQPKNHPHIADYLGCIVLNNRVVGLALSRYTETLDARIERGVRPLLVDMWLKQISEALLFLHEQGYAHNDVNPWNIMIHDENAILVDFDSCLPLGEELVKCGTMGWSSDTNFRSAITNDEYGLRQIELLLRGRAKQTGMKIDE